MRKKSVTITQDDLIDDITYDNYGRMNYHPDFHHNHGRPLTDEEREYLCKYWDIDSTRSLSFALGKTEATISSAVSSLKKAGLFEFYKNRNKHW